jgi:hypothetical protein
MQFATGTQKPKAVAPVVAMADTPAHIVVVVVNALLRGMNTEIGAKSHIPHMIAPDVTAEAEEVAVPVVATAYTHTTILKNNYW